MRKILATVAAAGAALAAGAYWFVGDGATPRNADYFFPIAAMDALIDAGGGELPARIRYEVVSESTAPKLATHAGFDRMRVRMAMTAFAIESPKSRIVIDSAVGRPPNGMDGGQFDEDAYRRMNDALATADAVIVTHEHFDHVQGIARHPEPARVAPRLRLTTPQIASLPLNSAEGAMPAAYAALAPAEFSAPTLVSPGIAVAPAPGHTPGSQIILVRTAGGARALFVGDIVWAVSNIEKAWGRPRLLQKLFFSTPEDRALVQRQVRALHDLAVADPSLVILPAHDLAHLEALEARGLIERGFEPLTDDAGKVDP